MFKKYTIAGESNPVWQIVEPVILKIWSEGMRKASYSQLYLIHFMALLLSTIMFLGGFFLRILIIGSILLLGYALFEEFLTLTFSAVFPSFETNISLMTNVTQNTLWIYKLLGYGIIIKIIIFVFGKNFTNWLRDTSLYLLIMVTGMIPLKLIAQGLIKENYFAQLAAKTSFMSIHMAQTISAAPSEIVQKHDKIIDLYQKSNNEDARKQLEELCATY